MKAEPKAERTRVCQGMPPAKKVNAHRPTEKATTPQTSKKRRKTRSRDEEELEPWTCVCCGFTQRATRRTMEEHAQCTRCSCVRGDVLHRERSAGVDHLLASRPFQTAYPFR